MLQELNETIGMEDMTTREHGACFSTKFAGVAYGAQLILIDSLEVTFTLSTLSVEAWEAMALIVYTLAFMAAPVILLAKGSCWHFLFLYWVASVDHKDLWLLFLSLDFVKLNCS